MPPTSRELQKLAAETGFERAGLEKVMRLGEVLGEIAGAPALQGKLVLKGGTALNLFHDRPQRLSVDLDLNYVGAVDRAVMLDERPAIEQAVEAVGRGLGYAVQGSREAHAGRKLYFTYSSLLGGSDRIEVDLNFLQRVCLLPPEPRAMWQPGEAGGPSVALVSSAELAAGKLSALLDRTAVRDLWDVAHLPDLLPTWPPPFLRPVFVAMAGALPHPLPSYEAGRAVEVDEADVRRLLHPLLTREARAFAAELEAKARSVVEPLLALTDAEREFSERLQLGELVPELLFSEEPAIAERLAAHPMLRWKAQNAAQHHGRRGR